MNLQNKILAMKKELKKIGFAVCMLTALMVLFTACSKQETLIIGSWEYVIEKDDGSYEYTGEIWTFDHEYGVSYSGYLLFRGEHYRYDIKNNSLIIHDGISTSNILILELTRTRMRLSNRGTMTFVKM